MHNFTKFIVVIAVIGAGVCAALPFRRLPPPSESTLAQNEISDQEPGGFDTPAANADQQPATDPVELNMKGVTGPVDPGGIADVEQYNVNGDVNPHVTRAPQIRARRKQESEFRDFADPSPPPDLPSDFQRSFGSDKERVDDQNPDSRRVDDESNTETRDASKSENKKKTNAKKRGASRKRSDNQADETAENSSATIGRRESADGAQTDHSRSTAEVEADGRSDDSVPPWKANRGASATDDRATGPKNETGLAEPEDEEGGSSQKSFGEKQPYDDSAADEPATEILADDDRPTDETPPYQTADQRPWASDSEAQTADEGRNFEAETDVAARETTVGTHPVDVPHGRTEMGFQTRDNGPADRLSARKLDESASRDDRVASAEQIHVKGHAPRRNTSFDSASAQPARRADDQPANPTRRAPPASMAVTRPPLDASSHAAAEPTPRIAKIERSEAPTFRRPQPRPSTSEDFRSWNNPERPVTPPIVNRAPTTVASAPQFRQYARHRVADGDSLASLAQRYLGNRNRYAEIFNANRHVLASPDILPIGVELVIPSASTSAAAPNTNGVSPHATGGWQPRPDMRTQRELVPIPADAFPRRNR